MWLLQCGVYICHCQMSFAQRDECIWSRESTEWQGGLLVEVSNLSVHFKVGRIKKNKDQTRSAHCWHYLKTWNVSVLNSIGHYLDHWCSCWSFGEWSHTVLFGKAPNGVLPPCHFVTWFNAINGLLQWGTQWNLWVFLWYLWWVNTAMMKNMYVKILSKCTEGITLSITEESELQLLLLCVSRSWSISWLWKLQWKY